MEKTLKLLMLLTGTRNYSVQEIAEKFSIDERTVYRYFNKIENAGFALDKKHGRYRLVQNHSEPKTLNKLFHFSDEEVWLLHQTLDELNVNLPMKEQLIKKLNFLYDLNAISKLENTQNLKNIQDLNEAIRKKVKVKLIGYRSSNSSSIEDRIVEPFDFLGDYEGIWCYETESEQVKQFKITRIQSVKLLNNSWESETEHQVPFTDAFRMSAKKAIATIEIQLNLKAYNLLREEFPLAAKNITTIDDNIYKLKIPIADYHGIGRFVMGLPGDIEIIAPEDFKIFITEKIKLFNY